jgi:tetratricopeptide (TPR) repeat protein
MEPYLVRARRLYQRGAEAERQGRRTEARDAFDEFRTLEPNACDDEEAWRYRVEALRLRRDFRRAADEADRAPSQIRYQPGLLTQRAFIEFDQSRFPEALALFERVIREREKDETGWVGIVACHRWERNFEKAREEVNRGLTKLGRSAKLSNEAAFIEFDDARYEEALRRLRRFKQVLDNAPSDETALVSSVACNRKLKRLRDAENAAAIARRTLPPNALLENECARVQEEQGYWAEALASYERVLALDYRQEDAIAGGQMLASCPECSSRAPSQRCPVGADSKRH